MGDLSKRYCSEVLRPPLRLVPFYLSRVPLFSYAILIQARMKFGRHKITTNDFFSSMFEPKLFYAPMCVWVGGGVF